MSNPIPSFQRAAVRARDFMRCVRCGTGSAHEWHHRRGRAVKDDHTHCTCNGILLCKTCHDWAHGHPFEARRYGWIVSRHEAEPSTAPVYSPVHHGWVLLGCNMEVTPAEDPEQESDDRPQPSPIVG